jgi:hypothetical protein
MTAAPRSEGEGHAVRESVPAEMTGAGTDVNSVQNALELCMMRTSDMDGETRQSVVRLCIDAHQEDFQNLFSYLPPEGLHVLAYLDERLVGHAVVTIRWLQAGNGPLLRTPYADAVASSPTDQGAGHWERRPAAVRVGRCGVARWAAGRRKRSFRRRTRAAS